MKLIDHVVEKARSLSRNRWEKPDPESMTVTVGFKSMEERVHMYMAAASDDVRGFQLGLRLEESAEDANDFDIEEDEYDREVESVFQKFAAGSDAYKRPQELIPEVPVRDVSGEGDDAVDTQRSEAAAPSGAPDDRHLIRRALGKLLDE